MGPNPKGYNRLYFDLNRNGDLTDDKVFNTNDIEGNATANQKVSQSTFEHIPVPLVRDGAAVECVFGMYVDYLWTAQLWRTAVQMRSLVYREGEIQHRGRKIPLLLIDRNSNGRFDDRVSFRRDVSYLQISDGDLLLVDPKLPGSRTSADATSVDSQFVNGTIWLGGGYYKLEVSPFGERVKLEPTELAVGYVSNGSPLYRVVVCCDDYGVMGIAGTKDQKVALPAGRWEIASYTIGIPGVDATTATASFQDKANVIEVQKGSTTELTFGTTVSSGRDGGTHCGRSSGPVFVAGRPGGRAMQQPDGRRPEAARACSRFAIRTARSCTAANSSMAEVSPVGTCGKCLPT